jgi:streptogramin lyase
VKYFSRLSLCILLVAIATLTSISVLSGYQSDVKPLLAGTIVSSNGRPLEGVTVSARKNGQTFTTTVYTNQHGKFLFPGLGAGTYELRIQAVGFKQVLQQETAGAAKSDQLAFTLESRPDFAVQMSSVEWARSLPDETPQDRRMRDVFVYTCSECHTAGFVLAKHFDAASWSIIIDTMALHQTSPGGLTRKIIETYKPELVEYLTRISGPQPYDWKYKLMPRPKGEQTNLVVTEYLIPRGNQPDTYIDSHNGTDWDEGVPARYDRTVMHDAAPDPDGFVYFTDNRTPERAFGKLDPATGHVTSYRLLDKDGSGPITHGIGIDPVGRVWATNQTTSTFLGFDPKTEKFLVFPKPESMNVPRPMILMDVDSGGILWASQPHGAMKLDPKTGEYTEFKSPTPGGMPYGAAVDANDNGWFAKFQGDSLLFVDAKTGKTDEVIMPPIDGKIAQKDIELGKKTGTINGVPAVYQVGPRRLGADKHGDTVWTGEYFAGNLTRVDINTKNVTSYPVPGGRYAHPYAIAVDKDHNVWFTMANTDQIGRFNQKTGEFTLFPLPTRGTEARAIAVDDSTTPATVWVTYFASNKIARVQLLPANPASGAN